jgi:predicted amidohydrolase YtcJ
VEGEHPLGVDPGIHDPGVQERLPLRAVAWHVDLKQRLPEPGLLGTANINQRGPPVHGDSERFPGRWVALTWGRRRMWPNRTESGADPKWPPEELAEAVAAFDADGFQLRLHAIGDAGVRAALDAIEHATSVNGPRDRRPLIAHTQLVHPADLPRFARLGVVANFEPLWARLDPVMVNLTIPRLGPDRAARQYPIGSLARSGARISFGSDWPVSSVVPMEGLAVAVTRQTGTGDPPGGWLPAERLPVAAALAAYTSGGAWQAFEEDSAGTITVGKRADLALLGADPTTIDGAELAAVPVLGTWLAGVQVFGG